MPKPNVKVQTIQLSTKLSKTGVISTVPTNSTNTTNNTDEAISIVSKSVNSDGGNFNYLYDPFTDSLLTKTITVSSEEYGLVATKITSKNLYYIHTIAGGYNNASYYETILDHAIAAGLSRIPKGSVANKLTNGSALPNCTAWAQGRVKEVWGLAKKSKTIIPDGSGGYKFSDGTPILGTVASENQSGEAAVPMNNGGGFAGSWSYVIEHQPELYKGWSVSFTPAPGCIMCWRKVPYEKDELGHVAFVEEVHNLGQDDEYVIVSESGFSNFSSVVDYRKITKNSSKNLSGEIYHYVSSSYRFQGFLYSPVTQLTSQGRNAVSLNILSATDTEKEAYKQSIIRLKGETTYTKLSIGDTVTIKWLGNTRSDNTGESINVIGAEGKITSVTNSALQYGVKIPNYTDVYYYNRDNLIFVDRHE